MGFRFRKQIKLFPGLKLNLSKRGASSATLGKKGAAVNLSRNGVAQTIGIPGTGLSYRTDKSTKGWVFLAILGVILVVWAVWG